MTMNMGIYAFCLGSFRLLPLPIPATSVVMGLRLMGVYWGVNMATILKVLGALGVAASILVFVTAPSAIQEIGGAVLWCGSWIMVGVGCIITRMDEAISSLPRKLPGE